MIASPNSLYDTRGRPRPGPAMVRESMGAPLDANPAPSGPESAPNRAAGNGDDDELRKLGDRIADLAARINSAEARMMTLIAEFDRRGGWKDDGYSSCAEWLAWRTGTKIGTARERVRTARALERLPQTADALKHGTISYAKVRALTRVATPEREAELLEFARAGSAAKLERTVRMWKKLSRDAELTAEQARHRSRTFSVFVDGDGMYVVKGRLEPEVGAVLMRAVEAASDALFRSEEEAGSGSHEGDARGAAGSGRSVGREAGDARPEPKQRRADAVGLLAERALAAGFGGGEGPESEGDGNTMGRDLDELDGAQTTESNAALLGAPAGNAGSQGGECGEHVTPRRVRHPGRALPGNGPLRRRYARGRGRARALGPGRDSRFRGDVAAHGVRRRRGRDGPREGRLDAERGPPDAHHSAAYPAGTGGARPGMPLPRMRLPVHGGASRQALGRRGRDQSPEHAAPLSAAPSSCSRGTSEGIREQ